MKCTEIQFCAVSSLVDSERNRNKTKQQGTLNAHTRDKLQAHQHRLGFVLSYYGLFV